MPDEDEGGGAIRLELPPPQGCSGTDEEGLKAEGGGVGRDRDRDGLGIGAEDSREYLSL